MLEGSVIITKGLLDFRPAESTKTTEAEKNDALILILFHLTQLNSQEIMFTIKSLKTTLRRTRTIIRVYRFLP